MNPGAWIVAAEWVNSSPTYYGPFQYAEEAELWATDHLADMHTVTSFELAILTPPFRLERQRQ